MPGLLVASSDVHPAGLPVARSSGFELREWPVANLGNFPILQNMEMGI